MTPKTGKPVAIIKVSTKTIKHVEMRMDPDHVREMLAEYIRKYHPQFRNMDYEYEFSNDCEIVITAHRETVR